MKTVVFALLALALIPGCTSGAWERTSTVVSERGLDVEVERWVPRDEDARVIRHDHPATVSAESLASFLRSVRYRERGWFSSDEPQPAVGNLRLTATADALARGLALAGPAERVRFAVESPGVALRIIPAPRTTRGVAFVEPAGILNLAFDLVGESMHPEDADTYGAWGDPTRRTYTGVDLLIPPAARVHTAADGKPRPHWITAAIADLDSLAPVPAVPVPTADANAAAAIPTSRPEPGVTSDPPPKASESTTPVLTDEERLSRLRFLEELHRDGLIDDADYEKKRRALLFEAD